MTQTTFIQESNIKLCENPPEDITFNRHGGAETSNLADKRVKKSMDRATVYGYVKASGAYGLTLDEASILLDRPCNCISGRFSELRKSGEIVQAGTYRKTRTGSWAAVYVAS